MHHTFPIRAGVVAGGIAAALGLSACAPTLNWRDVRPEGADLFVLFPCKPSGPTRSVPLAGAPVQMTVLACEADGMTFGLSYADVGDAARVGAALQALAAGTSANLGVGPLPVARALAVPGAASSAQGGRYELTGRQPDGQAIQARLGVFARGTLVYQATVLGNRVAPEAVETFFGSLKVGA